MGKKKPLEKETKELQEELGEFLDDFIEPEPIEESVEEEIPEETEDNQEIVGEQVEEEVTGEPDVEEEEIIETAETTEEVVEDQGTEEVFDESDQLRAQNEALLKRVEELSGKVISGYGQQQPQQPPEQKQDDKQKPPEVPNFLEGYELEELFADPKKLNEVLVRAVNYGQQQAVHQAHTQTLRTIPEMVLGYITRHTAMNQMVDDFYKENSDLANVKQTVAAVANDIHSKNPDWSVDKVFTVTADETRKLLGLKKSAQEKVLKPQTKKPAFAKAKTARREELQIGGLQKEINDLLIDI